MFIKSKLFYQQMIYCYLINSNQQLNQYIQFRSTISDKRQSRKSYKNLLIFYKVRSHIFPLFNHIFKTSKDLFGYFLDQVSRLIVHHFILIMLTVGLAKHILMSYKKISGYIIHLKEVIGKGSYGEVYRGEQQQSKTPCAIKVINRKLINSDEYLKAALLEQIQILQQVKSPNIVAVYEVMQSPNNYYIIQQLCESDLQNMITSNAPIAEEKAIEILKDIVNGFVSLIKEGIIHRDIKPANILISKGIMKIADFGFAKRNVSRKMKNETSVGTPLYMSAQVLKGQPYTSKCDVWAVGVIFYELLHRKTPWIAKSVYQLVKNIETKPLQIDQKLSALTKDFLKKTLGIQEKKRASWDEVFQHKIFNGFFEQYSLNNKAIENKLKTVMSRLRFKITSENIDIKKMLKILGLESQKIELNYAEFHKFLDYIHPDLPEQEIRYFFDKVDQDSSGTISIAEIQKEMSRHNIVIDRGSIKIKKATTINMDDNQSKMSNVLADKAKKSFERLHRVLSYKKISLKRTFQAYDKEGNGNLTYENFKNMITRLDPSFTEDDIQTVFNAIDIDHSKSIEFQELNAYYCKVNGLPFNLDESENHQFLNK